MPSLTDACDLDGSDASSQGHFKKERCQTHFPLICIYGLFHEHVKENKFWTDVFGAGSLCFQLQQLNFPLCDYIN